MDPGREWPAEWLRGVLELCTLRMLADGPTYGYELSSRLTTAGLGQIKGGTLYPLLRRFEKTGLVSVEWRPGDGGPGRKYYALTTDGHRALGELSAQWRDFTRVTADLLSGRTASDDPPDHRSANEEPTHHEPTHDGPSTTRRHQDHGA